MEQRAWSRGRGVSGAPCSSAFVLFVLCLLSALGTFAQQPGKKGSGISVGEPPPDHSPEAELASLQVLDGFAVNLFASEADGVANPLVLRWDERGRLWVLSTTSYPQPAPGAVCDDRILILEDADRDGRMDKKTIFADGLRMPTGMELAGPGELYVGEGEKLWLFKDTNGDDRMDVKEAVLSGFGTGDTHQNINSFIWSPDGALVMHQGLHCYSKVATPWGVKQLHGAGFWRFWPRSRRLEAYPTGMPQNAWGTAFMDDGQPIMVAGAAGMFWSRPMEIEVPVLEPSEVQPSNTFLLTRFMLPFSGQIIKTDGLRKFCGVDIVGNAHFPKEMQGEVITGGFFENAIYRHKIVDDKDNPSGYEAIEQPPLIKSSNVAFRPVDVRFGPEGALYIADWYDPIIGHYQASFRHPNRDSARGRIWRVVAKGGGKVQNAEFKSPNIDGLLDMLERGDRWNRYQAQRLLLHSEKREILEHSRVSEAGDLFKKRDKHGFRQATTAWQMRMGFEEHDETLILHQLSDESALRRQAARSIAECSGQLGEPDVYLAGLIADADPRVRLEAIVALAKTKKLRCLYLEPRLPEGLYNLKILLRVLDHPMDSFLDRALWLAIHATAPHWKPAILKCEFPDLPPKHLAYLIEKEGSAEILGLARTMLAEKGDSLSDELKRALSAALVRKGEPGDMLAALKLGLKSGGVLNDLAEAAAQRGYRAPQGALPLVRQLVGSGSAEQQVAAIKLAAAWRMKELAEDVARLSKVEAGENKDTSLEARATVRIAALEALGRIGGNAAWVQQAVAAADEAVAVRLAALKSLVDLNAAAAGAAAVGGLGSMKDAEAMRQWLAPLLPREAATKALVAALKAQPCSADAAKLALQALTAAGRSDAELTTVLNGILGVKNTVPAYDPAWVSTLAAEVKSGGDVAHGKAVFAAALTNCKVCHRVAKEGGVIGPELDQVGRGVPVELLIEAVVWPNRQIKEGYVATTLATKDGRRLQGYKVSDAGGEMQLRDFLSGTVHRIPLGEITEKQEAGSLMPEGLIAMMTREELRDLIAYLGSLGR